MDTFERISVVTGANRGLGLETCRQLGLRGFHVILASRDLEKGKIAADQLCADKLKITPFELDVANSVHIRKLANFIIDKFGRVDILINNAGILLEPGAPLNMKAASVFDCKKETIMETMETNVYGPMQLCQMLIPIMKRNNYGRIVNVSSGMGQISSMQGGWPAYRISKLSLNALTCIVSSELKGSNILVNSVCPEWVKTDMGGAHAPLTPQKAVLNIVKLATIPDWGPSGRFFRNGVEIPW